MRVSGWLLTIAFVVGVVVGVLVSPQIRTQKPAPVTQEASATPPPATARELAPTPPVPLAPIDLVALLKRLADASNAVSCAMPQFAATPAGGVRVFGPVGAGAPSAALQSVIGATAPATARVVWDAQTVPAAYCGMLDLLRPIVSTSEGRLALSLHGEVTQLRAGQPIKPDLRVDFPAYVQLDYLSSDGLVAHLFPLRTSPDRPAEPGVTVSLDELAGGHWQASAPFGVDMIVAVASSVPLFAPQRLAGDTVQTYVPILQAAIETARRRDAKVVAQIFVLTTER